MGRSFAWYQIRLSVKMNANTKVNARRRYNSLLNYFGHLFNYVVSHLTLFSTVNFANSDVNTYFMNVAAALNHALSQNLNLKRFLHQLGLLWWSLYGGINV